MTRIPCVTLISLCACPLFSDKTDLSFSNERSVPVTVYVSFGSDSAVTAEDWDFCDGEGLTCEFTLRGNAVKKLPLKQEYINATFSVNQPVGCGVTKAEVNLNNDSWYDTMDVSLVDGFSDRLQIVYRATGENPIEIGLPNGKSGNERVLGLFPLGCDVCVDRQNPPCGIPKGGSGCKAGTQYDPHPPCQYQGKTIGGGGSVEIQLKEG